MSHASCLESAVSFLGLGLCRLLIRGLSLQASSCALSFCRNPSPCPWSRLGAVRPCWLGLCESWRQHLVFVPLWFTCPSASEAHEAPSGTLARCPT